MLRLTPVVPTFEDITDADRAEAAAYSEAEFSGLLTEMWQSAGTGASGLYVTVGRAVDADGESYSDVAFLVTGRFKTSSGTRWVTNGDIAVNLDAMLAVTTQTVAAINNP